MYFVFFFLNKNLILNMHLETVLILVCSKDYLVNMISYLKNSHIGSGQTGRFSLPKTQEHVCVHKIVVVHTHALEWYSEIWKAPKLHSRDKILSVFSAFFFPTKFYLKNLGIPYLNWKLIRIRGPGTQGKEWLTS